MSGLNEQDKNLLYELHRKYVLGEKDNNKEDASMNNEIVEGLGKVKEAVDGLKTREKTKAEKQLDQFLGTEFDTKLGKAKDKLLEMSAREQAAFKQANPELYEKMFPSEKVEVPKPNNYDAFKKLVMQNEKDVAKLPYNVRLFAELNDPDFASYIKVADMSIQATQTASSGNPVVKKLKELEAAEKAAEAAKEGQGK